MGEDVYPGSEGQPRRRKTFVLASVSVLLGLAILGFVTLLWGSDPKSQTVTGEPKLEAGDGQAPDGGPKNPGAGRSRSRAQGGSTQGQTTARRQHLYAVHVKFDYDLLEGEREQDQSGLVTVEEHERVGNESTEFRVVSRPFSNNVGFLLAWRDDAGVIKEQYGYESSEKLYNTCRFDPPLVHLRHPLAVGLGWSYSWVTGEACDRYQPHDEGIKTTEDARVVGEDVYSFGGRNFDVFLIERRQMHEKRGSNTEDLVTEVQIKITEWYSPEHRVFLKQVVEQATVQRSQGQELSRRGWTETWALTSLT